MSNKPAAFILTAVLTGCVSTLPPSLSTNNPANAEASEPTHVPRSVLVADATTGAINKRLHETSDTPQTGEQKMQQGGDGMNGMKMEHDMSGMNMAAPSPPTKSQPSSGSYYTCVMHPEVHKDKLGDCPICGMKLVKKEAAQKGQ